MCVCAASCAVHLADDCKIQMEYRTYRTSFWVSTDDGLSIIHSPGEHVLYAPLLPVYILLRWENEDFPRSHLYFISTKNARENKNPPSFHSVVRGSTETSASATKKKNSERNLAVWSGNFLIYKSRQRLTMRNRKKIETSNRMYRNKIIIADGWELSWETICKHWVVQKKQMNVKRN